MNFDDGCNSTFNFSDSNYDADIWNSPNPLGAVFDINIPLDNGAVVVSQFGDTPNCYCWTFSTITNDNSTRHPVSGNRQFGLLENTDGSWTFYTRGADRATNEFLPFGLDSRVGFLGADMLWNCLMNNVENFINENNGNTIKKIEKTYRPNWEHVIENLNQLPIEE